MSSDLGSYPIYKESGVAWLDEIPEEWDVAPARSIFEEIVDRGHAEEQMLSVTIGVGVLRQEELLSGSRLKDGSNLDKSKYKLVQCGDIVYNKMRAWQGALGRSPYRGIVSPAYIVMRSRGALDPKFAHRLLRTPAFSREAERWSYGITSDQWSLRADDFKQIYFPVPPRRCQEAIVRYVERLDSLMRRLIGAKERLLRILEEERRASIHGAMTRGLDADVPLSSSGVVWLGDLPSHWDVCRLKNVTTGFEQGWSPQCEAQPAGDAEWGVLKVGCVNGEAFNELQNKRLPADMEPVPRLEVRDGDILVSRANTRQLVGLASMVRRPRPRLILSDKLFRFGANEDRVNPAFLVAAIRQPSSRFQIESKTHGASDSMQNIGQDVIRNLWLAVPPLEEQKHIVAFIQDRQALYDQGVNSARRQLELLREYRTRLISDVVTGKLDVREAAAGLPDDPEADDPELDERLEGAIGG